MRNEICTYFICSVSIPSKGNRHRDRNRATPAAKRSDHRPRSLDEFHTDCYNPAYALLTR